MTLERIAVATAVISAAVSAGGLLLAWHRGSAVKRPKLARTLGGVTIASAIALVVALAFAAGGEQAADRGASGVASAGEYGAQLIDICEQHRDAAERIERAEGDQPAFSVTILIERDTTDKLRRLRPPEQLAAAHRRILDLWGRRLSLLEHFYGRYAEEIGDPAFRREFRRGLRRIEEITRELQERFTALGVTPECALFV
jgi:hypothetical protein